MKISTQKNTMSLNADDLLEAIKLYCDKNEIFYDPEEICWRIENLDHEEGHTDSDFTVQLSF